MERVLDSGSFVPSLTLLYVSSSPMFIAIVAQVGKQPG